MALLNFNASAIKIEERSNSFDPLPAGDYELMITKSETKPTKANDGSSYLELEMQVISGEHSGRRHWERLNLANKSKQTVEIAEKQLAKLCLALGFQRVEDSVELHDLPFIAEIGIDKKDPTRNVIWGYQSAGVPTAAPAKPAAPAPAAAPAKTARPWGQKS